MSTPRPDPSPASLAAIDDAAAAWIARRDRGLTAAEQDEFLQWLAADPRHGERLARHQRGWSELGHLSHWRPEHAEPNPDLLAPAPANLPARRRLSWLAPIGLAAAAVVALLLVLSPSPAPDPAGPAIAAEPTEAGYRQQVLDDGTLVELNGGAQIEIHFTETERRVQLVQGDALFTVAKNVARPFVVHAGDVQVRAVGTAFNVSLRPETVAVLVTEGRVELARPAHPLESAPLLERGDLAVVPRSAAAPTVTTVTTADVDRILAWQPRLLEFAATPLAEVAEAFNRRNRVQLVVADPALVALPIGASFRSDNVDGFVRLLEVSFGIAAERRDERILLRRAR